MPILQTVAFSSSPAPPGTFYGLLSWSASDISSYLTTAVLPNEKISLAFAGVALIALVAYLAWRLVRCCAVQSCCGTSRQQLGQQRQVLGDKANTGSRLLLVLAASALFLGLGGIGAAVYGMVTLSQDLTTEGWSGVEAASQVAGNVADTLDQLLAAVVALDPIMNEVRGHECMLKMP